MFNECDGHLQVLSHTKVEHDAGKPPPAGGRKQLMDVDSCGLSDGLTTGCVSIYLQKAEAVTFSVRERSCLVGMRPMLYLM